MVRLPTPRPSLSATGFRPDLVHGGDRAGAFDRFRGRSCGHAPATLRDANETWLVFGESPHGEGHDFQPRGPLPRLRMQHQTRPGSRAVTSWTIHVLSAGSFKEKKDP
jgi:hypothetical protein